MFVTVRYEVTNGGSSPAAVQDGDFHLMDRGGQRYSPSSAHRIVLAAGYVDRRLLIFDIPESAWTAGLRLRVPGAGPAAASGVLVNLDDQVTPSAAAAPGGAPTDIAHGRDDAPPTPARDPSGGHPDRADAARRRPPNPADVGTPAVETQGPATEGSTQHPPPPPPPSSAPLAADAGGGVVLSTANPFTGERPDSGVPSGVATTGRLSVFTDPWTMVYLDGRRFRQTPLAEYPMAPGRYHLTLVNEEAGIRLTEIVVIEAGATTTIDRNADQLR